MHNCFHVSSKPAQLHPVRRSRFCYWW